MPTLMACQAKMVTVQWNEEKASIVERSFKMDPSFVTGYRKTALETNEVILSILLPYTTQVCQINNINYAGREILLLILNFSLL